MTPCQASFHVTTTVPEGMQLSDPEISAALIGGLVGALVAGGLTILGAFWADRRRVIRNARVGLYIDMIQPMIDNVEAGWWDHDDAHFAPLLRHSWMLPRRERKLIRAAYDHAWLLVQAPDAERDVRRDELVRALEKVQRTTARKIL